MKNEKNKKKTIEISSQFLKLQSYFIYYFENRFRQLQSNFRVSPTA